MNFTDENEIPIQSAGESGLESSGASSVWIFVRMVLVLALVIVVIYVIFRLMKKNMNPVEQNDPFLRKVSEVTLSPGKSVQIVTLVDKAYVIGVSDDSVTLLDKLEIPSEKKDENTKDLIDSLNLYADQHSTEKHPGNFGDILEMFMGTAKNNQNQTKPRTRGNIFSNSADSAAEMLKKQRKRLNEENEK